MQVGLVLNDLWIDAKSDWTASGFCVVLKLIVYW